MNGQLRVRSVFVCICMYLHVFGQYTTVDSEFSSIAPCNCTAVDSSSTRAHRDTFLWQKKTMFNAHLSAAILVVVNWPNHGPGVDVEQGPARARGSLTVAHAKRIARILESLRPCMFRGMVPSSPAGTRGLSHCRRLLYDDVVWCWMTEMAIPASVMMPRKS